MPDAALTGVDDSKSLSIASEMDASERSLRIENCFVEDTTMLNPSANFLTFRSCG